MKKTLLLTLVLVIFTALGFAQDAVWAVHDATKGKIITDKAVARQSFPKDFKLFDLNINPLSQKLFSITNKNSTKHSTIISLPNADGSVEQFEVFEASNFEPALQAQFPEIRAFSGKGITDKYATLKLSISPQGIQAMVFRTDKENEFVEAYSKDHTVYAAFRSQRNKGQLAWTCSTDDQATMKDINAQIGTTNRPQSSAGELKTMRLAQSCTAEYSNYFGATSAAQVGLVLAAYNASLTRCNGVYEKDLALHLNLIATSTQVIFYDPATDPYSPGSVGAGGAWNGELQATLTSIITDANYDIGHLFGATGGGGNAGCIGCVCSPGIKGRGFTSPGDGIPQGDNFDIDYVVHEVGHQLGGNHTFSHNTENSGNNKEVGSGITIMGYAGITPFDVAPHSIDIFHETSIEQIQNNLATKTCPITTSLAGTNATPVVAAVSNYTIPISTPFVLTGSATDANAGDVLTYCWEQNDQRGSATGAASSASPTKTVGPNFLSFSPTVSPLRYFPRYTSILANAATTVALPGGNPSVLIEALSSVSRVLNFRLTVRDNAPYTTSAPIKVGQTAYTDMTVTVDGASGPFQVTVPNTFVSYPGASTQTVTWDVNNTATAPISCANVKISYSTDGGLTFPTVILASTPNDGTQAVTIPVGLTTTARIKVEAVGNIFFDISNTNFTVTAPLASFDFVPSTATTLGCGATSAAVTIATTSLAGFVTPIILTAGTLPAGTTLVFAPPTVVPGNSTVATLSGTATLASGTYNIIVTGVAGVITKTTTITYIVPVLLPTINTQPTDKTVCAGSAVSFSVAASGLNPTYQWQVKTSSATVYADIIGATSATYAIANPAATLNGNMYRVNVFSTCSPVTPVTSSAVLLTVNTPATITTQPIAQSGCALATYLFAATATSGTNPPTYQWQYSADNGVTYFNIPGATSASYTLANAPLNLNGFLYRVVVSTTGCSDVVSSSAKLTVTNKPTVVLTKPATSAINPAVNTQIFATVSPANGNFVYTWRRNGVIIPNTLGTTSITLNVDDEAVYSVKITDVASQCQSDSSILTTTAKTSDNLFLGKIFVYPNPVQSIMQVRYNNSVATDRATSVNIYDEKGIKVFSQQYVINNTFGRMSVDMSRMQNGVFMVYLIDKTGKRIAGTKVVKLK